MLQKAIIVKNAAAFTHGERLREGLDGLGQLPLPLSERITVEVHHDIEVPDKGQVGFDVVGLQRLDQPKTIPSTSAIAPIRWK